MFFHQLGLRIANWVSGGVPGPFNDHDTLTNGLVSYWNLDEQSGVRYDSITDTGNDLTDNNTVGFANTGPGGTVASFTAANVEKLTDASTGIDWTGPTTTAFWFKAENVSAYYDIFNVTSNPLRVYLAITTGQLSVDWRGGAVAQSTTLSLGWHFLVASHDGAGNYSFSLDGGTPSTASGAQNVAGTGLFLGTYSDGASNPYQGLLTRVGQWSVALSSTEITSLFNSGKGKSYSDLTTAEKVGLVSYWNLDEASGNRADSHGSNDLTDNNTVGSATNSYPANLPGVVASFVAANSEYLNHATVGASLDASTGITIAGWVKVPAAGSGEAYFSLGMPASNWLVLANTGSATELFQRGDESTTPSTQNTTNANFSAATWHMCVLWYEPLDKKIYLQLDGTTPTATAALTAHPNFTSGDDRQLRLGEYPDTWNMNGNTSSVAIWSRVLTAAEREALWNEGRGLYYGDTGL